jgi:hypothetical protein
MLLTSDTPISSNPISSCIAIVGGQGCYCRELLFSLVLVS